MVADSFHWNPSDSKNSQLSIILLSILADLNILDSKFSVIPRIDSLFA